MLNETRATLPFINMSGEMDIFEPEIGGKYILGRIWGIILLRVS